VATQPDDDQDDTLDLTEDMEVQDDDQSADDSGDDQSGDDDQERVTFEDEADADQPDDNSVVRRCASSFATRTSAFGAGKTSAPAKIEIGPKPSLYDDGIDGDEELTTNGYSNGKSAKRLSSASPNSKPSRTAKSARIGGKTSAPSNRRRARSHSRTATMRLIRSLLRSTSFSRQ
jgi:hypothetical protein